MDNKFIKLSFICLQQLTNFPYIEEDFDALTTYGFLCNIVKYLNKLIENENHQNDAITELYNNFTILKEYVEQYLVDIEDIKQDIININTSLNDLDGKIEENKESINILEENLKELINQNFNTLKTYIDYNDNILDEKITNIQIGEISVYNPTNGLLQPLQVVINNIYESSNKDGLTASEFDNLELTASGFDAYQITASEFDTSGKIILV